MKLLFFIGGFTAGNEVDSDKLSAGIALAALDDESGQLELLEDYATGLANPTWLEVSSDGSRLYSVAENKSGSGEIVCFRMDTNDSDRVRIAFESRTSSQGRSTCHLSETENALYTASYGDGKLSVFQLDTEGIQKRTAVFSYVGQSMHERQKGSHAHQALLSPDGSHLFVCDLGVDSIHVHDVKPEAAAIYAPWRLSIPVPVGYGPRHLVFNPSLPIFYLVCELQPYVMVYAFCSETQKWESVESHSYVSALDPEVSDYAGAAIRIHPTGYWLAVSERRTNTLVTFKIGHDGMLSPQQTVSLDGATPREFDFAPNGKFVLVALQKSNRIQAHPISEDGMIGAIVSTLTHRAPSSIAWLPKTTD